MKYLYSGILLFLSLAIQAQEIKYDWAKSISGKSIEEGTAITTDASGNIYTVGHFEGTCDIDPSTNTHNISSKGFEDIFIQKLDSNGNFIWAKTIGGLSNDFCTSIHLDSDRNIYLTGTFRGKVDFDPGQDSFYLNKQYSVFILKLNSHGNFKWVKSVPAFKSNSIVTDFSGNVLITGDYYGTTDFDPGKKEYNLTTTRWGHNIFILKLDALGNFVWAKANSGTAYDYSAGNALVCDSFNNVYISGIFNGIVDFDPGSGTKNLGDAGKTRLFVQKLDSNGDLVWAKSNQGNGHTYAQSLDIDVFGNLLIVGDFNDVVDFDPGSGTHNLSATQKWTKSIFILKLDNSGNFEWAKSVSGKEDIYSKSITTDLLGNVYTTGYYGGKLDFNPSTDSFYMTSLDSNDIYVLKLDSNGKFSWAQSAGGTKNDKGNDIAVSNTRQVHVTGFYHDISDFNPGTEVNYLSSKGSKDAFILKLKQGWDSCTDLTIIHDSISHFSCVDSGYISVHVKNGNSPYSYTWDVKGSKKDSFISIHNSGIYTVNVKDRIGCSKSSSMLINGPSVKSGHELDVNLISERFRVSASSTMILDAFNSACDSVKGELSIVLDPKVILDSVSIKPSQMKGDTLIWKFNNLKYGSAHLKPLLYLTTKATVKFGDKLQFKVQISPLKGDYDSTNNIKLYEYTVINSYDPNDKQVFPVGKCDEHYVMKDKPLTYTIRFQNTGNAEAINIYILDKISPFLDLNSIKIISQSHENLVTEVLPNRTLKFRFDHINLPDSNSNEVESHGYVVYKISPKLGVTNGARVNNKAEIYFDHNAPIITNTVFNTLVDEIPKLTATDIQSVCKSYTWIDGKTYTSNNNTATYTLESDDACDTLVTLNLTINEVDTALTLSNGVLTANSNNAQYQWLDCDNGFSVIPSKTNQSFTPSKNGNYAAIITQNNCTDTSNCHFVSVIGVQDLNSSFLTNIYPNPNTGEINIEFKTNGLKNVQITDLLGHVVFEKSVNQKYLKINLDAPAGVYILSINNARGATDTIKLIKE